MNGTRSETVVPIMRSELVVGLIEVESEQPNAFNERDGQILERCASLIASLWPAQGLFGAQTERGGRRA